MGCSGWPDSRIDSRPDLEVVVVVVVVVVVATSCAAAIGHGARLSQLGEGTPQVR